MAIWDRVIRKDPAKKAKCELRLEDENEPQ